MALTNGSTRPIDALYVYPLGAVDHGASRGTLAPNASTTVQVKAGNIEVHAVSAKVSIDTHTRETRTASSAVELTGPKEVVFFDAEQKPAMAPGAIGAPFQPGPPAAN